MCPAPRWAEDGEARRARSAIERALFGEASAPELTMVGRYRVLDSIGAGGMGVVYRAHDPELARDIAIKLLHPDAGAEAEGKAELARARLQREARAMARLAHPNVIHVYDVGAVDEGVFVAMELVEGHDFAKWLIAEPRTWQTVLQCCLQAGDGLAAAHAAGLVHRDFKPENVLIGSEGRVRVVDFGLARDTAPAGDEPVSDASNLLGVEPLALTRTGALLGTPLYMAPEQYEGKRADARSDQFAYCVTVFEAIYGTHPFAASSLPELRDNLFQGRTAAPPLDADAPGWLWHVLVRGMSLDPEHRYASMDDLLAELRAQLDRAKRSRWRWAWTRRSVWGAASMVSIAAVLASAWWLRFDERPRTSTSANAVVSEVDSPVETGLPNVETTQAVTTAKATDEPIPSHRQVGSGPGLDPGPGQDGNEQRHPIASKRRRGACYMHEDSHALIRRAKGSGRLMFRDEGQCYACRRVTNRAHIDGFDPNDCASYFLCGPSPHETCQ